MRLPAVLRWCQAPVVCFVVSTTEQVTTVTLSMPPRSIAARISAWVESHGHREAGRTVLRISSSVSIVVRPSEQQQVSVLADQRKKRSLSTSAQLPRQRVSIRVMQLRAGVSRPSRMESSSNAWSRVGWMMVSARIR